MRCNSRLFAPLFAPLKRLFGRGRLMEFGLELLVHCLAKGSFDELARLATTAADEALGFDARLAIRRHNDFDRLHATPST